MNEFIITRGENSNEIKHYGVLGMKWGVRRYQNSNGSLTSAGKAKYRTNRIAGHVGRAITNGSVGQRVIGVGLNKGYRQDKKEIKSAYKSKKNEYKSIQDKATRKEKVKSLKSDYKKTKGEARTVAADVLYPYQSKSTNEKIQTQHLGKQVAKSMLMGGYGTLNYDRLTANNTNRGVAAVAGVLSETANQATTGGLSIGDYIYEQMTYKKQH